MNNGIHYDLPEQDYHALDRVSKSYLWRLNTVPAAAKMAMSTTADMIVGSATHAYILEGEEAFLKRFVVAPKMDRRTKEGKALYEQFQAESCGRQVITVDDYAAIIGMNDAVHAHPLARDIMEVHGYPEVSALWTDDDSGMDCKARADLITPQQVIIDLKTCRDASPSGFLRSVVNFGYYVQAAWYLEAFRDLADSFVFIAVEKEAPYRCEVYELEQEFLLKGRDKARELVNIERSCRQHGYPHYTSAGINTLYAPAYL